MGLSQVQEALAFGVAFGRRWRRCPYPGLSFCDPIFVNLDEILDVLLCHAQWCAHSQAAIVFDYDRHRFPPGTHQFVQVLTSLVVLQLLAYYTAVALGRDVDKPRNLAKSVTVE